AGVAHRADHVRPAAELRRPRLQPADAVVDVLERGRVGGRRRLAEVERRDDDAAARQRFVDELVGQTVLAAPGATVQLDHDRERPGALWPVEARQLRCIAVTHIFDVLDLELVAHGEPPLAAWKNATIRPFTSSGRSTCTKCPVPGTMTF